MVRDPLSLLDSIVVSVSGFFIVFLMLAVLWGIILVVSRVVGSLEHRPAPAMAKPMQPFAAPRPAAAAAPTRPAHYGNRYAIRRCARRNSALLSLRG